MKECGKGNRQGCGCMHRMEIVKKGVKQQVDKEGEVDVMVDQVAIDHSYDQHIHIKEGKLNRKRGRTELVLVPALIEYKSS